MAAQAGKNGSVKVGGVTATGYPWQFYGINSTLRLGEDTTTPVAVYVCWNPDDSLLGGTHWATDA